MDIGAGALTFLTGSLTLSSPASRVGLGGSCLPSNTRTSLTKSNRYETRITACGKYWLSARYSETQKPAPPGFRLTAKFSVLSVQSEILGCVRTV